MSEVKNPFNEPVAKAKPRPDSFKQGWIAAGLMAVPLIVVLLLWASTLGKLRRQDTVQTKRQTSPESNALSFCLLAKVIADICHNLRLGHFVARFRRDEPGAGFIAIGTGANIHIVPVQAAPPWGVTLPPTPGRCRKVQF